MTTLYNPFDQKAYNEASEKPVYLVATTESETVAENPSQDVPQNNLLGKLQPLHGNSYGWALVCCQWDQSFAEDVLQEAYLRVIDGRAKFSGKSTEKTWFFAIIKLVAKEQHRKMSRFFTFAAANIEDSDAEQFLEAANDSVPLHKDPDPHFDERAQEEANEKLIAALKSLSSRQRELLHLVFYSEMSIEEAALTLGISLGSARTHYQRGKDNLNKLLNSAI